MTRLKTSAILSVALALLLFASAALALSPGPMEYRVLATNTTWDHAKVDQEPADQGFRFGWCHGRDCVRRLRGPDRDAERPTT